MSHESGIVQTEGGEATQALPTRRRRLLDRLIRYLKTARGFIVTAAGIGAVLGGLLGFWQVYKTIRAELQMTDPLVTANGIDRPRLSIAILPLISLADASQSDYFADGLTEDIISALARFPEITVRSRDAVFAYKGKSLRAEELGRELAVRYVVDGSVRRNAQRIKVTIRLTDASNSALLWSENYDAEMKDIFAVQDDITRRVAGRLAIKLSSTELARISAKPPASLEAYDLVLRGRDLLTRLTRTTNNQARALFERAMAIDPRYVPAYVGLGFVQVNAVVQGWTADPVMALKRAEELGLRATEIDQSSAGAHALLGQAYRKMGEIDRALDELRRAITLNSSDPDNYAGLGDALLFRGDTAEAIEALETAAQFRTNLSIHEFIDLGIAYILTNRVADAVRILERGSAHHESMHIHGLLAAAYAEAGRIDAAERQAEFVRRKFPHFLATDYGLQLQNPDQRARLQLAFKKAGFG
jgi:TolB-like protein